MLFLLDSSAVLNDFGFQFKPEHNYTTTALVIGEFRDMRSRHLMENALQQGLLSIQEPNPKTTNYVEDLVAEKGFARLSKPDISLIALGIELKKEGKDFLLISDDYSIQNFAKILGMRFEAAMRGAISKAISFSISCPACGKTMPSNSKGRKCPVCGSKLQRKKGKVN